MTGLADLHQAAPRPGAADRAENQLNIPLGHAAALRSLQRAHHALTRPPGDAQQPSGLSLLTPYAAVPDPQRAPPTACTSLENLLATRSVIARPTATGYAGVSVQWDGYPSDRLPLLLAAHRYRFGGDLDALARHLIDEAPEGWWGLGTDLLDGAPASLRTELVGDDDQPSSKHDAMFVITIGDVGPEAHTFTEQSSGDLDWGYVLHPHGIEVISLHAEDRGPVVGWDTNPRTRFSNAPYRWRPGHPIPVTRPTRAVTATPPAPPARTATPQTIPRR